MPEQLRCSRCGRRVGIYLSEMGRYLAHVIPLALHRAQIDMPAARENRRYEPDWYDTHCPTCDALEPNHTPTCAVVHVGVDRETRRRDA